MNDTGFCKCPKCGEEFRSNAEGSGVSAECASCGAKSPVKSQTQADVAARPMGTMPAILLGCSYFFIFLPLASVAIVISALLFGWIGALVAAVVLFGPAYVIYRRGRGRLSILRRLLGGPSWEETDPALRDMMQGKYATLIRREVLSSQRSGLGLYLGACAAVAVVVGIAVMFSGIKLQKKAKLGVSVVLGLFATGLSFAPNRMYRHPRIKRIIGTGNPYVARSCCILLAAIIWVVIAIMTYASILDNRTLRRENFYLKQHTRGRSSIHIEYVNRAASPFRHRR